MNNSEVYLDFEGNIAGEQYLVGLLTSNGFEQINLHLSLIPAAEKKGLRTLSFKAFLEELRSYSKIYCYSEHELELLGKSLGGKSRHKFEYVNLAKASKVWINKCRKEEFESLPPYLPTASVRHPSRLKNSLASRMRLTSMHPPHKYAPGLTTARFNTVIQALNKKHACYDHLTSVQKSKYTNALKHNQFDVEALKVLKMLIEDEYPSALKAATKHVD